MKKNIIISALSLMGLIFTVDSFAQSTKIEKYLDNLPQGLKTDTNKPMHYKLTIDWTNRDIDGNPINHSIAIGELTKAFENDSIKLSNVTLTEAGGSVTNKQKLKELDGLKYKIDGDNFTKPDFYKDFPQARIDLIRWFVQDQLAFEVYGLMYFDSLKLDTPFYPDFFRNHKAQFDKYVNFNTRDLNITWTGISKIDNEICALIHFQALYNTIDADTDVMKLNGRSCFWGDIWISLNDKQIEYATMSEDLIFKMNLKANNYEQRINLQRELKFEKIK